MTTPLIAIPALVGGLGLGILYDGARVRCLQKQLNDLREGNTSQNILRSVTRFLFVTTQICALVWVSWSYIIATYSTVVLLQPFPAEELSREAVRTILGVGVLKVVENIFEHNDGPIFGRAKEDT